METPVNVGRVHDRVAAGTSPPPPEGGGDTARSHRRTSSQPPPLTARQADFRAHHRRQQSAASAIMYAQQSARRLGSPTPSEAELASEAPVATRWRSLLDWMYSCTRRRRPDMSE